MSVSNLTNTIWVFENTFVFSQSGTYSIDFTSGGNSYTSIKFANLSSGKYVDYDNTRVFGSTPNTWISQGYRILKITGGSDVTNSTLIAWFNTVAKQISVEDLSNTSWVFDSDEIWTNDLSSKSINFISNGNNYTSISVSTLHAGDDVYIYYGSTNIYEYLTEWGTDSWLDNQYRLISITDGTDTNNPDLMLFLAKFATQVQVDDLTNTKWVIDSNADLSMGADYGVEINFTSNGTNYVYFRQVGDDDELYYEQTVFGLGNLVYRDDTGVWTNQAYRLISITGGTDVSNPDLLVWLNDNATLVPVVDLSGTEWVFNNEIDSEAFNWHTTFQFNFTSNSVDYTYLLFGEDEYDMGWNCVYYQHNSSYRTGDVAYDDFNGWSNNAYKSISITNGTDATNPDLIVWLTENATYQEEPVIPVKTFDLSTLGLTPGTHEIKVKARASGYRDSNFSNSVSYVVNPPTYEVTVIVNESHYYSGKNYFRIYDGQDNTGTLLYEKTGGSGLITTPQTLICSSGYLYFELVKGSGLDPLTYGAGSTGNVSEVSNDGNGHLVFSVSGTGTITFDYIDWDD